MLNGIGFERTNKLTEVWSNGVGGEVGPYVQNTILPHIMRNRHSSAKILVQFRERCLEVLRRRPILQILRYLSYRS